MARNKAADIKTAGIGKGTPGPGRPKGRLNKTTAAQRHAIHEAFEQLGGVESLVRYGKADPKGFYALWGKTIPTKVEGPGEDGAITYRVIFGNG